LEKRKLAQLEELYRREIAAHRFLIDNVIRKVTLLSSDLQILLRVLEKEVTELRKMRAILKKEVESLPPEKEEITQKRS